MQLKKISIDEIERWWCPDEAAARRLLKVIEDGYQPPVKVIKRDDSDLPAFKLLEGFDIAEACRRLKRETIDAVILEKSEARPEIVDHYCRLQRTRLTKSFKRGLSDLFECAIHLDRRKVVVPLINAFLRDLALSPDDLKSPPAKG